MKSRDRRLLDLCDRHARRSAKLERKALLMTGRIAGALVFAFAVLIATEKPAYAYTDPGSATLIWQIAISSLIGAAYYFRKFLTRIIGKGDRVKKEDGGGGD